MNEKERLLHKLRGEGVDRIPVICPGGMMSACVTEILEDMDTTANLSSDSMMEAAIKIHDKTGFENYGVPFAMIAEAEPLGIKIDNGNKKIEERIIEYNNNPLEKIMSKYNVVPKNEMRMGIVIDAIGKLSNDFIPVIGNITGIISTATSVIDPLIVFKMLIKQPERIYSFFEYINEYLMEYAKEMIKAGVDVITIADPTASGEILGKKNFEKFAVPFYKEIIKTIHGLNVPVIVHICGNTNAIIDSLNTIGADAISFDSIVNIKTAKSKLTTNVMGNVSTQLLHLGEEEKIRLITRNCIKSEVDIVSSACGLSMATPIKNLKAMTQYVKRGMYD